MYGSGILFPKPYLIIVAYYYNFSTHNLVRYDGFWQLFVFCGLEYRIKKSIVSFTGNYCLKPKGNNCDSKNSCLSRNLRVEIISYLHSSKFLNADFVAGTSR